MTPKSGSCLLAGQGRHSVKDDAVPSKPAGPSAIWCGGWRLLWSMSVAATLLKNDDPNSHIIFEARLRRFFHKETTIRGRRVLALALRRVLSQTQRGKVAPVCRPCVRCRKLASDLLLGECSRLIRVLSVALIRSKKTCSSGATATATAMRNIIHPKRNAWHRGLCNITNDTRLTKI